MNRKLFSHEINVFSLMLLSLFNQEALNYASILQVITVQHRGEQHYH